jgi:hypothetical protein
MDIFVEAPSLLRRYQKGDAFRRYVDDRAMVILPVAFVFLVFSLATTAGAVVSLGGTHSFLVLLMLILAPFLILGGLAVQLFVFFSWLESRAIAQTLARMKKAPRRRFDFSWPALRKAAAGFPPVPWLAAAIFVALPLLLLGRLSPGAAILVAFFALAAPLAYSFFDR